MDGRGVRHICAGIDIHALRFVHAKLQCPPCKERHGGCCSYRINMMLLIEPPKQHAALSWAAAGFERREG